jgi:hypothetical protein
MKLEIALQTLRDVIRRKHFSLATERSYLMWVARYSRFVTDQPLPTSSGVLSVWRVS